MVFRRSPVDPLPQECDVCFKFKDFRALCYRCQVPKVALLRATVLIAILLNWYTFGQNARNPCVLKIKLFLCIPIGTRNL